MLSNVNDTHSNVSILKLSFIETITVTQPGNRRGSCPNSSARGGGSPPVWHHVVQLFEGSTTEAANDRENAVESILVQRHCHAKVVGHHMYEGS